MSLRRRFRATYRAFEVRVADIKLIVILRVGPEFLSLDLRPILVQVLQYSKSRAAYLQSVIYV